MPPKQASNAPKGKSAASASANRADKQTNNPAPKRQAAPEAQPPATSGADRHRAKPGDTMATAAYTTVIEPVIVNRDPHEYKN